jgi:heme O synthase-like polyprenyltransferase
MVPMPIIILLFLVSFFLATWQYVQIDPRRRVLNVRFGLMVGAIAAAIGYPLFVFQHPDDRLASWLFLGLGLFWICSGYYLLRRMPPRENY